MGGWLLQAYTIQIANCSKCLGLLSHFYCSMVSINGRWISCETDEQIFQIQKMTSAALQQVRSMYSIQGKYTYIKRGKWEKGDASSLKLNLTDPCRIVPCQYHCLMFMDARPVGWGQLLQYMREYNAKSPKQGRKRFKSQGRRNTFPIWPYNLSMTYKFYNNKK